MQMRHFKAKMQQIRFRLGPCPRPHWGSLQHSPRPLPELKGPNSRQTEGGRERKGDERVVEEREERGPPHVE